MTEWINVLVRNFLPTETSGGCATYGTLNLWPDCNLVFTSLSIDGKVKNWHRHFKVISTFLSCRVETQTNLSTDQSVVLGKLLE